MVDRLRALLDHPLDPSTARAILAFASAILLGLATLLVLASEPSRPTPWQDRPAPATSPPLPTAPLEEVEDAAGQHPPARPQDPQDVKGSMAANRAARALRSHRALQHVPYRDGQVTVALIGAKGNRAILRVSASTIPSARRGWHRFLRRYRDSGRAYTPFFQAVKGRDG